MRSKSDLGHCRGVSDWIDWPPNPTGGNRERNCGRAQAGYYGLGEAWLAAVGADKVQDGLGGLMKLVWLVTSVCVCTSSTLRSCVPQPLHQSNNLAFAVVDPRAARHGRGGGERRGRCGGMGDERRLRRREEEMRCAAVSPRASSRRRRGRRQGEVEALSSKQLRLGSERKVEAEEGGGLDGKPVAAGEGATLVVAGAK